MFSFLDLIILISGIYVLYAFYLLKFKGEIKESLLLPKGLSAKNCKDKAAYIAEVSPKLLLFGIAITICGALGIAEDQWQFLGNYYLIVMAVFLAIIVWFGIVISKAAKKYW